MENQLRKLIREAINQIFEVQDGKAPVVKEFLDAIRKSELSFFSSASSFEVKDEIEEKLLNSIRSLRLTSHVATEKNRLSYKPNPVKPVLDKSEFAFNLKDMVLYKLGSFLTFDNGEFRKVYFKYSSLTK